jgi:uncharacterized membrane protein
MAGIGFKLKKMLMEDTYSSIFKAYLYSAVISSGPWLLSILSLSFLGFLSPLFINEPGWLTNDWKLFGATMVYIFAFSLISTGVLTYVINRYIADKIYLREAEAVASSYLTIIVAVVAFQGLSSFAFFSFSSSDLFYIVAASSLYVIISCIWIALIFLSASENYKTIILIFFAGSVVSVLAALAGGKYWGLPGLISGFSLGQALIFFGFSYDVFKTFGFPAEFSLKIYSYGQKYKELVYIGLLYYLAIWADKFIFWFSDTGRHLKGLFFSFDEYDFPMFIAYLTMIPSLAIFLVNIETNFYTEYRSFYEFIMSKKSFQEIHQKKQKMQRVIRHSLVEILKLQGLFTLLAVYFAPVLLNELKVSNELSIQIFRYTSIGVFFHAYVLILSIILLYFDFRKDVLVINLLFALSNIAFTLMTKKMGPEFYGLGQMSSCLITFAVSMVYLNVRLKKLEFLTFSKQPIIGSVKDSQELLAREGGGYGKYISFQNRKASPKCKPLS